MPQIPLAWRTSAFLTAGVTMRGVGAMRLVFLLVLVVFLPACSIPRAIGMYALGKQEIAVIPGGKVTRLDVVGRVTHPYFAIQITAPQSVAETADWYVQRFAGRGWAIEKVPNSSVVVWEQRKDDDTSEATYRAVRRKWPIGKEVVVEESITLKLRQREATEGGEPGSVVYISLDGKYAWDFPSDIIHQVFFHLAYISPLRPGPVYDVTVMTLEFIF